MTNTIISTIRTVGKRGQERKPPHETELKITNAGVAAFVNVEIRLPGRPKWTDLGLLRVENEVLDLPVSLAFLCHAEEDEAAVARVGDRLEGDAIITWFSPKSLAAGADWKAEIDSAMEAADFVVVFLSKVAVNKRGYFQREVKRAFELREQLPDGERFIIPVLLEDFAPPARFADIHWIRLNEADGYHRLATALRLDAPG
jgi:hypothetical protein